MKLRRDTFWSDMATSFCVTERWAGTASMAQLYRNSARSQVISPVFLVRHRHSVARASRASDSSCRCKGRIQRGKTVVRPSSPVPAVSTPFAAAILPENSLMPSSMSSSSTASTSSGWRTRPSGLVSSGSRKTSWNSYSKTPGKKQYTKTRRPTGTSDENGTVSPSSP